MMKLERREMEKEVRIRLLEEYYDIYGRLPKSMEIYKQYNIGYFMANIKRGHTIITKEQKERLERIGFSFRTKKIKMELLEEFYQLHKRFPKENETYKGIKIGKFLVSIKTGSTSITDTQRKHLEEMGFSFIHKDEKKEYKIRMVEEFYEYEGRLPKQIEEWEVLVNNKLVAVRIGAFLSSIRNGNTKITKEQLERLRKLGFNDEIEEKRLGKNELEKIERFFRENNRLPEVGEKIGKERSSVGDLLFSIRTGTIRITEGQLLRLQRMDSTLLREQISLTEKKKTYVKK